MDPPLDLLLEHENSAAALNRFWGAEEWEEFEDEIVED